MRPKSSRQQTHNESGQALVEFALVLPLLRLLLFGIIQFGFVFNHHLALTDAVRAGARQGAVARFEADPIGKTIAAVEASAANLGDELDVSVSSSWDRGSTVTVTATYPYSINLIGIVVKSGNLTSSTTERVE